jgi:hypothetical protein
MVAPLTVALALLVSGVAKLRPGQPLAAAFEAMGVPLALRRATVVQALPWLEIVLGVALLVLPHPVSLAVTALALLLVLAYLGLVLRAVLRRADVDCHCFGGLGSGRVTGVTLLRNVLLAVAACWGFADAVAGHSFLQRLGDLHGSGTTWLLGGALLAATAVLVVWRPAPEPLHGLADDGAKRRGIPYVELVDGTGAVTSLPALAAQRPLLLVMLSATCGACAVVLEVVADWPAMLPGVDVRVVTLPGKQDLPGWPVEVLGEVLVDRDELLTPVLGMFAPSAVLLGADALVAGGPVGGAYGVVGFAGEIRDDLASR